MDPNYAALAASDGSGEPVRVTLTAPRSIGSTILTGNTPTNWPTGTFIATTGTLLSNGTLDPTTAQVFYGTVSGSNLSITSFAAGYSDLGNTAGDVVVIKPTTEWANLVSEGIESVINNAGLGWVPANETWTYASASTINVPSGAKYQVGWRVQFTQSSTVKYGIITAITSNVLTLLMLNSTTVANSTISANNFSLVECPAGMQGILWTSYSNAGSAGGTFEYTIHVDGTKELIGIGGSQTIGGSAPASASLNLTLPASFFTNIEVLLVTPGTSGATQYTMTSLGSYTTSTVAIYMSIINGSSGVFAAHVHIKGT